MRPFSHIAGELLNNRCIQIEGSKADNLIAKHAFDEEVSYRSMSKSLTCFSCSHVVPSSHIKLICLSHGPTSTKLDFRHASRASNDVCDELGRVLYNVSCVVPAGVVVFLPSYSYLSLVVKHWKRTGAMAKIREKKRLYLEPRNAREVEETLNSFSTDACNSKRGAVLLSVVGGKMSEGINFADDMARCVLVAGLPYPDITSPELKEKMRLMDEAVKEKTGGISGQKYYHNLCMRAINQSIGRAIRHEKDYATIILADARYSSDDRVWQGLPDWLKSNSDRKVKGSYGQHLIMPLRSFFKRLSKNY